jgi:hypothetical protein
MIAAILAAAGLAGCGGSSSSTTAATEVTVTTAGANATTAPASTAAVTTTAAAAAASTTAASSQSATKSAVSSSVTTSSKTATVVHPTKHAKAEVVDLCRVSVQAETGLAPGTQATLSKLCQTAVEGRTASVRKKAAETICLGLIGATAATPESAKKVALKDCKTNSWD